MKHNQDAAICLQLSTATFTAAAEMQSLQGAANEQKYIDWLTDGVLFHTCGWIAE